MLALVWFEYGVKTKAYPNQMLPRLGRTYCMENEENVGDTVGYFDFSAQLLMQEYIQFNFDVILESAGACYDADQAVPFKQ